MEKRQVRIRQEGVILPTEVKDRALALLSAYRIEDHDETNRHLNQELGLFVKVGKGTPRWHNNEQTAHQFVFTNTLYPYMPGQLPKPFMLGEIDEMTFYVLERINSRSLRQHLIEGLNNKTDVIDQLTSAIRTMLDLGIEHRDLHSGNILIENGSGRVILIDPALKTQWIPGRDDLNMLKVLTRVISNGLEESAKTAEGRIISSIGTGLDLDTMWLLADPIVRSKVIELLKQDGEGLIVEKLEKTNTIALLEEFGSVFLKELKI